MLLFTDHSCVSHSDKSSLEICDDGLDGDQCLTLSSRKTESGLDQKNVDM